MQCCLRTEMQVQVKELPGDEGREDPGQTGKGVWGVILNVPVRGKGRMTMLFWDRCRSVLCENEDGGKRDAFRYPR